MRSLVSVTFVDLLSKNGCFDSLVASQYTLGGDCIRQIGFNHDWALQNRTSAEGDIWNS